MLSEISYYENEKASHKLGEIIWISHIKQGAPVNMKITLNSKVKTKSPIKKWPKNPKVTMQQGRYIDSKWAHEKMFNMFCHQGNALESWPSITVYLLEWQNKTQYKQLRVLNPKENTAKSDLLCIVDGNVKWYRHFRKQFGGC